VSQEKEKKSGKKDKKDDKEELKVKTLHALAGSRM
jgi:hypothetical protein